MEIVVFLETYMHYMSTL